MGAIKVTSEKKVDLDDILEQYGIFDRFHLQTMFLAFLAFASNTMYSTNFVFAAEEVEYRCKDDVDNPHYCYANSTQVCSEWLYDEPDSFVSYFQLACHGWKRTLVGTVHSFGYMCGLLVVGPMSDRCKDDVDNPHYCYANSTQVCSEWLYDEPDSFVSYFQLACHEWKRTLVGTVHSFGYMCGLLIVGPMSDRVGRKTAFVITGILGGFFGLLRSFSPWYWFYIAMEFLEAAIGDSCSPMYVLVIEIVSTKRRLIFNMMCGFGYFFGGITLAFVAWLTPNWRWFLRAIYIPGFLFFVYKFLLDESPRWLLTKGRKDEAVAVLEKAAKKNKLTIDKDSFNQLSCDVSPNVPFNELLKDTFKSSQLRKRFFVCLVWWTASTFINYGMIINSVTLQGNKYINYGLSSLVEIPASLIVTYILIHFKRKLPLMLSFFTGAVLCIAQPFIPLGLPWLSITFYMVGRMMSSFFFTITYMYTSELFPTYTRNSMHALCSSLGRVGAIIAPQTPLLRVYWSGLPSLVFGLVAVFAGLTTFLVPDVSNDLLPDTVLQAESLGKSKIPSKAAEAHIERDTSQL